MSAALGRTHCLLVVGLVVIYGQQFASSRSGYSESFPIGSIFDKVPWTLETQAGFQMAINKNNKDFNSVRIQSESLRVDMHEPYSVSNAICNLMSSGIFALCGQHNMETLSTFESYTSTFKMPFVSLNMPVNEAPYPEYHLYMKPNMIEAILDVIQGYYRWTKVHYMYDTRAGLENYQQLLNLIHARNLNIRLIMLRVRDADDAIDLLHKMDMRDKEDKQIIMDLPTEQCKYFLLEKAKITQTIQHHYFLAGLGLQEFTVPRIFANGGMNITGFKIVDFDSKEVTDFLGMWQRADSKDWEKRNKTVLMHEPALAADAVRTVSSALTRLNSHPSRIFRGNLVDSRVYNNGTEGIDCQAKRVSPWERGDAIMAALKEVKFNGLTGNVEFDEHGFRKNFNLVLMEVTVQLGLAEVASWSYKGRRLRIYENKKFLRSHTAPKVENQTRIVTSILTSPYLFAKPGHPGEYDGYCADLAAAIANEINITYKIVPVPDAKYGSLLENGTWNGMVGELVRHKADLAIAPLTITSGRERVVHFSKPFMSLGISIMIKKNEKKSPGVFSFMYPLSYEIWMCVIFAYIGVSVVLFLVSRFSPYEWHIEDNVDGPSVTNNFTIFNSLWFSLGAFMQQGCDIEPRSLSGRIVGSVWWFFTLIVISSYTANLAAFLTVSRMQSPIESADDLAKQTEIKYGTLRGGSTENFFKTSEIAVYERMWAFMSAEPGHSVDSNEEGVDRVRRLKGRYAFLIESTTNDYINQREPCDTMKVGNNLDSKGYGIGTPLGSDLRENISLAVLVLRENGVLTNLETKWWYKKGQCGNKKSTQNNQQDTTNSLKLSNVAGIFYILVAGLVLALSIAFLEFTYKSRTEAQRRRMSFTKTSRAAANFSIKGKADQPSSNYAYTPAAQLVSLDGYADVNTHTEV